MHWQTTRFRIALDRPRVMGIVNATPDSFSDGGRYLGLREAVSRCETLLADGADLLDIGGESSRPGTPPVSLEEERARVLPLLREALALGVPVSLDTYKPQLMREALDLGVDIINDIRGLQEPGAIEAVAAHPSCGACVMHMHGEPETMQQAPMEGDVVPPVIAFLTAVAARLESRGVDRDRICWDPGIGFGKTVGQNFDLLARQDELLAPGYPVLVGWSRKSSLGSVTGLPVHARLAPSVAAAVLAAERGAHVIRVHDVKDTVAALKVLAAVQARRPAQQTRQATRTGSA